MQRTPMMRRGFARRIKYLNKSVILIEKGNGNETYI